MEGGEAILGPSLGNKSGSSRSPPPEMRISRQKLRPGSGMLSVKVLTDGPTRVLQVTDISQQVGSSLACSGLTCLSFYSLYPPDKGLTTFHIIETLLLKGFRE